MGIYGPRTVYVIALKDAPGCHEFLLQDDGKWLHVKETTEIGEPSRAILSHKTPQKRTMRGMAHGVQYIVACHISRLWAVAAY